MLPAISTREAGRWTRFQFERLIADAALVDISERSSRDGDATLTPADLAEWRAVHGRWVYPTILLVRTGYAAYWSNRTRYFGISPKEPDVRHFPGLSAEAARELAADSAVVGVGIDTPSVDPGISHDFLAHQILFSKNIYALENLADLSRVPASGIRILAMPMKIGGGSGGPCRVVVNLPAQPPTA
ncbi:isatin hydrolase-like [Pollicipes pollicipes]|uniref:isatin hydrolase-like n=1 Tax=Pollicipes pollicipes TaxID=41117 RepID=UPI0018858A5A|nr:isatin hydrolase-like [Pollicipes pollicipes]